MDRNKVIRQLNTLYNMQPDAELLSLMESASEAHDVERSAWARPRLSLYCRR